jgi:hypothetical protein
MLLLNPFEFPGLWFNLATDIADRIYYIEPHREILA